MRLASKFDQKYVAGIRAITLAALMAIITAKKNVMRLYD